MSPTIRRVLVVAASVAVSGLGAAGVALADTGEGTDDPTAVHVLQGVPPVPVQDPAVVQNTVLPPVYNGVNALSP